MLDLKKGVSAAEREEIFMGFAWAGDIPNMKIRFECS